MSYNTNPTHLLWIDYETTGLWTPEGPPMILEFAALLLPFGELDPAKGTVIVDEVFPASMRVLDAMDPYVTEMHTTNGLLKQVAIQNRLVKPSIFGTESAILGHAYTEYSRIASIATGRIARALGTDDFDVAAAGSGISSFDMPLMRERMPELYNRLRYTPYDVSAFRRAAGMVWPGSVPVEPPWEECPVKVKHRAMPDVEAEMWEAAWLRENFKMVNMAEVRRVATETLHTDAFGSSM